MVVDTMENLEKYVSLNPLFEEVVKFVKEHDLMTLEVGKHPIKGDDLFLNIAVAKGKTDEEAVFETLRRMLDIQIPLDAPEAYGYIPLSDLPEAEYYDAKDVTKYPGVVSPTLVNCKPGDYAMFWPHDGHKPCVGSGEIRKAIFKVRA